MAIQPKSENMRKFMKFSDQRGSGSISSVGVLSIIFVLLFSLITFFRCIYLKYEAQNVVNLSALYGAYINQNSFNACDEARLVANKNGYELSRCNTDGHDVVVSAKIKFWMPFYVTARAGETDLPCEASA